MNPLTRSRLLAVVVTVAAAVWAAPAAGATAAPVSTSAMPAAVDQATPDTSTAIPRWLHQLSPRQYTTFDGQHSFTLTPWQGQHVAVLVPDPRSGEVMAKILAKKSGKKVELHSINPAYPPRTLDQSDIDWMGRIVWVKQ